jgi:hypothetical protein
MDSLKSILAEDGNIKSRRNECGFQGPHAVYLVQQCDGKSLFAGEAQQLRKRLEAQFDPAGPQSLWLERGSDLSLHWLPVSSTVDYRLARQSLLLKWYQPQWNQVENLAC